MCLSTLSVALLVILADVQVTGASFPPHARQQRHYTSSPTTVSPIVNYWSAHTLKGSSQAIIDHVTFPNTAPPIVNYWNDENLKGFLEAVPGAAQVKPQHIGCVRKEQSYSKLDQLFNQWKEGVDSFQNILTHWNIEKEEVNTLRTVVMQQVPVWYHEDLSYRNSNEENICIPEELLLYGMLFVLGHDKSSCMLGTLFLRSDVDRMTVKEVYPDMVGVTKTVNIPVERKLSVMGRKLVDVENEHALKSMIQTANGDIGTTYSLTVNQDIAFTGSFDSYTSFSTNQMALLINDAKVNITGGVIGRKTELKAQGQSGGYMVIWIQGNAVVNLQQLKITNGYRVSFLSLVILLMISHFYYVILVCTGMYSLETYILFILFFQL